MTLFKRKRSRELRVFFATDVHGSDVCFRKFLNAANVYKVDVLIIGGDITGKRVIPVVRKNGRHYAKFGSGEETLATKEEVDQFLRVVAASGNYGYVTDDSGVEAMAADNDMVETVFRQLASDRLQEWLTLAAERLSGTDTQFILNCGNDDPFEFDRLIEEAEGVTFAEGRVVRLDSRRQMISCGYANMTPWHCERDVPEDKLASRIAGAVEAWDGEGQLVMNLHCPPRGSGLDLCPQIDEDLKVVGSGGSPTMAPAGSTAVREAIERWQPVVSLHGHIHESRGVAHIGQTLAVNPGSEYPDGILRGALIDFDSSGVQSYVLTSG